MKGLIVVLVAMVLVGMPMPTALGDITDPEHTNQMLTGISTPVMEPGDHGNLAFTLTSPSSANVTMENITLEIGIYLYKATDILLDTRDIASPPTFTDTESLLIVRQVALLAPGESEALTIDIRTAKDTPWGEYFSQGEYFVRFILHFDVGNDSYILASRGHFSNDEWDSLTNSGPDGRQFNQTYLESLGYDGLITETSFAVLKPVPWWPFLVIVGITAFTGFLAFSSYIVESDTANPKLKKSFQKMWGKFYQFRKIAKHRLGGRGLKVHVPPRDKER